MATSDMGDSQTSASSASGATIDWAAAFQSPEFLSGLQTAIAGVTTSTPRLEQLEQLGESIPSQPSTSAVSASGNLPVAQGTFHAPTFVTAVNDSVPNGSSIPPHQPPNKLHTIHVSPLASSLPAPNIAIGPEKAFSLGPGRAPIPPKLVTKSSPQNLLTYPSFSQRTWTIPSRTLPVLLLRIQPSCLYLDLRANVKLT